MSHNNKSVPEAVQQNTPSPKSNVVNPWGTIPKPIDVVNLQESATETFQDIVNQQELHEESIRIDRGKTLSQIQVSVQSQPWFVYELIIISKITTRFRYGSIL